MYLADRDFLKYPLSDKAEEKEIISGDVNISHLYFLPGAIESRHENERDEYMYIISGKFEFAVNGDSRVMDKGDTVYIPRGSSHSVFCLEKGEMISFQSRS
ncbi:MAG TPA: cupin domain-containing protein [Candidatus Ornithospirochaeta avicola]|uniref:Cupin domain-containing protein n=1 Tax=Candidatus Ornithospirochaeta avicola TaxID=2840896 RepID=A0A9D1PTV8_9SPIO|nr:cupin domain-containing protein [Candidatus Ornithospirochaeta avicola]